MNHRVHNYHRALLLLLLAVLLGGCATTGMPGSSGERRAERLADNGNHGDAAGEHRGDGADEDEGMDEALTRQLIYKGKLY